MKHITLQTTLRLLRTGLDVDARDTLDVAIDELDRLEYVEAIAADLLEAIDRAAPSPDIFGILGTLRTKIAEGPNHTHLPTHQLQKPGKRSAPASARPPEVARP